MTDLWQVGISRGDDAVTTEVEVGQALYAVLGIVHSEIEAEDVENGIWLVELPVHVSVKLQKVGYLEVSNGRWTIDAEMP